MDSHARATIVKGHDLSTGKTKSKRFGDRPSAELLMEWVAAHFISPFYAAYESGCTGFHFARALRAIGITCDVIAVSNIARSGEDKKRS